ncbi:OmpH family outer membrane protein [Pyruvatibacter sp.]|uniref:OmpH family outer membrane protein n=1 Tax=Pyruvatibacter sp. TaxID=1981328 RepID=UPI003266688F
MLRNIPMLLIAAAVLGAVVLPSSASAQVPPARALFLDLETVFTQSDVGKDIRSQLQVMLSEISAREKTTAENFVTREQALLAGARDRDPAVLQKEWEELQAEKEASGNLYQIERTAVQSASNNARRQVNTVLNEIMQGILVERGANIVMSVGAVYVGGVDYDITAEVIARLDKRMPKLKVERPR